MWAYITPSQVDHPISAEVAFSADDAGVGPCPSTAPAPPDTSADPEAAPVASWGWP